MMHLLFWGTIIVGVALISWALVGNKSAEILNSKPLYIVIFSFIVTTGAAIFWGSEIYKKLMQ